MKKCHSSVIFIGSIRFKSYVEKSLEDSSDDCSHNAHAISSCSSLENIQTTPITAKYHSSQTLCRHCLTDDPLFNAALDRTQTTIQNTMMIVAPALAALGVDMKQLSLSRTSLMCALSTTRIAATLQLDFQPIVPLIAHFDRKLLQHQDRTKREVVVCSGMIMRRGKSEQVFALI